MLILDRLHQEGPDAELPRRLFIDLVNIAAASKKRKWFRKEAIDKVRKGFEERYGKGALK